MRIGITCYPTYGGSGVVATELGTELAARGRHDPCVVPRAVVIVEAMAALVLADHKLLHRGQCG